MPLYSQHFQHALAFVWTFCALVSDPEAVPIGFILSSPSEEQAWRAKLTDALAQMPTPGHVACPMRWRTVSWETAVTAVDGASVPLSAACATQPGEGVSRFSARWRLVALKKLYGMLYFDFGRTFVIDSESRVLRPTRIAALFSEFAARPSYWYSTKPGFSKTDAMLPPAAARLLGRNVTGRGNEPVALYDELGLPRSSFWMDVQHWIYDRPMVRALASRLSAVHGSAVLGLCFGPAAIWDPVLFLMHLYNFSQTAPHCHPFYDMRKALDEAGLGDYTDVIQARRDMKSSGYGEKVLWTYSDHPSTYKKRLLSLFDHRERPIFVYRERGDASESRGATLRRELVCEAKHLTLSVCAPPPRAFSCDEGGQVVLGLPRWHWAKHGQAWVEDLDRRLGIHTFKTDHGRQITSST